MNEFMYRLEESVPQILIGIILIIVALGLAFLAKYIVRNLYNRSNLEKRLKPHTEGSSIGDMLGNLAFILVLLFFLPGILSNLGLTFISTPILGMLNGVYNYIPNIIGAALVLVFGFILAKLVKDIATLFFRKAGVDAYQERLGLRKTESTNATRLSDGIGKLLYAVVLIPLVIAALNILNISVISQPAVAMLNDIFAMIPLILAALVVLIIGIFIAKLVAELIYSLTSVSGISDRLAETMEDTSPYRFDISRVISEFVRFLIIAIFAVQALNILKLDLLNKTGSMILTYIPRVLAAAFILVGGYILASLAKKFIKNNFSNGVFPGVVAKWIIMALAGLAALSQLGIATEFIMPLYWLTLLSMAVAGALAFGLGGRDFAAKQLEKVNSAMNDGKGLEETVNKIVSQEEEREKAFEADLVSAKQEHEKRVQEVKDDMKKKQEAVEEAKRKIEQEIEEEKRRKEEEERRIAEEKRRIEEEKQRKIEEEKRRIEEEKRRREEEKRLYEEEKQKRIEEERRRREAERNGIPSTSTPTPMGGSSIVTDTGSQDIIIKPQSSATVNPPVPQGTEGTFTGDSFKNDEPQKLPEMNEQRETRKVTMDHVDGLGQAPKTYEVPGPEEFKRDFGTKKEEEVNVDGYEVNTVNSPHDEDLKKSALEEANESGTTEERIIDDVNEGEKALLEDEKKKF